MASWDQWLIGCTEKEGALNLLDCGYRNGSDRMVIVRCVTDAPFFLERVVFPFELLSFLVPRASVRWRSGPTASVVPNCSRPSMWPTCWWNLQAPAKPQVAASAWLHHPSGSMMTPRIGSRPCESERPMPPEGRAGARPALHLLNIFRLSWRP